MKTCQYHRQERHDEIVEETYQEVLKEKEFYLREVFSMDLNQDQDEIDAEFKYEAKEYAMTLDSPYELDQMMIEDNFVCDCHTPKE